jgi:hypothetical protein
MPRVTPTTRARCALQHDWQIPIDRVLAAFERLGGGPAREAAAAFFDDPSSETLADYVRVASRFTPVGP